MILQKTGTNLGSLCKIEIAESWMVKYEPYIIDGVAFGSITLQDGQKWEELYFTDDTAHFVEKPVLQNGAEVFQLAVKFKVPKDSEDTARYLQQFRRKRYVAKLTQTNGVVVLAGSKDEPAVVAGVMRDIGQNARDSNHYIVQLSLTRNTPAIIIP